MEWVSILISILVVAILFFSFIGGFKEGAVKRFFSFVSLIIAIPVAGVSYHLLANLLSFLPGENWENFVGFLISLVIVSIILHLILLLPRKLIQKVWNKGFLFRLIGGVINIFNSVIGMVVFALLIQAYPIIGWLERAVVNSSVLVWLVVHLGFVQSLLPDVFQGGEFTIFRIAEIVY